jgi:hypothetical protein
MRATWCRGNGRCEVSAQVDNAVDELEAAMLHLRRTLRGIPTDLPGFKAAYEKARKATGVLLVGLTDVKSKIRDN